VRWRLSARTDLSHERAERKQLLLLPGQSRVQLLQLQRRMPRAVRALPAERSDVQLLHADGRRVLADERLLLRRAVRHRHRCLPRGDDEHLDHDDERRPDDVHDDDDYDDDDPDPDDDDSVSAAAERLCGRVRRKLSARADLPRERAERQHLLLLPGHGRLQLVELQRPLSRAVRALPAERPVLRLLHASRRYVLRRERVLLRSGVRGRGLSLDSGPRGVAGSQEPEARQ